ncbi:MAG: hypothetical protein LUE86_10255 [Clostridiales bacterium]|nr:hypothetical protein [Clostridiales bacterium]
MRLFKVVVTVIFLSILGTFATFAKEQPTDPFTGEPIEWDVDDIGNEDEAGLETDSKDYRQDYVPEFETEIEVVSEAETEPEIMQTVVIRLGGTGGSFDDPDINIILYQDGYKKKTVILRASDGFYTETELPVGKYTLGKAESDDGKAFELQNNTFYITEDEPVKLVLREKTWTEEDLLETMETAEIVEEETTDGHSVFIAVVAVIVSVAVIAGGWFAVSKIRK